MKGSTAEHQKILQLGMLDFQRAFPDGRIFTRVTGKFVLIRFIVLVMEGKARLSDWERHLISVSIPGQCDAWGWFPIMISGFVLQIHFEVECKSGNAMLNADQRKWRKQIESLGVLYIMLRKPEDIRTSIFEKYGKLLTSHTQIK